ncbi:DUF4212 domain-containing protein [Halobacteria archaeon AArc-curdl1]|uniref:DUF4212 domain-containing protein n=1 Tax=Natronosalvus hydrolyticus TaxID=2979988 RepID=A0AAP3E6R4_9EURY|nr:DUF4212 domain-containing protein [Halobacteria archaeon AArc-curdl1]
MTENNSHETTDDGANALETDGGVSTDAYLDKEINIFKPATPFMRDHLLVIWAAFLAWILVVFGPVTGALLAPEFFAETTVLGGFPLHFFLTAIITPLGALVLSVAYAIQRDRLDTKYGIEHETETADDASTVAADGGDQ